MYADNPALPGNEAVAVRENGDGRIRHAAKADPVGP